MLCDPEQTVELPHPFLAGVVLTLHIYPEMAEAAWHLEGNLLWEGLPCEA